MIECDYELKRKEGGKEYIYKPDKQIKKISNISYIKAPNSFGKSTFLNILSLGLFAQKEDGISDSLKRKINDLKDEDHQKLRFNFKISNDDGSLQIISEKPDLEKNDVVVNQIKDGKKTPLTPETIKRNFYIIYDIPNNPIARLKQLVEEIRLEQTKYGNRLTKLRGRIQEILFEIQDSKNPERISELRKDVSIKKQNMDVCKKSIISLENEIKGLEKHLFLTMYSFYLGKHRNIMQRLELNKKNINQKFYTKKKVNSEYNNLMDIANRNLDVMKKAYDDISLKLNRLVNSENKHFIDLWDQINLDKQFKDLEFNELFETLIIKFKNILNETLDAEKGRKDTKETELYEQIEHLLTSYEGQDIELSLINNKTIEQFLQEIRTRIRTHKTKLDYVSNLDNCIAQLAVFNRSRMQSESLFRDIKKIQPQISVAEKIYQEESQKEEEVERLKKEGALVQEKFNYYKAEYESAKKPTQAEIKKLLGDKLSEYTFLNEDQLKSKINDLKDQLSSEQTTEKEFDRRLKNLKEQIDDLEKKDEHEYQKHKDKLDHLSTVIASLAHKINEEFFNYLEDITNYKKRQFSKEQADYNEQIFEYLGNRIGTINTHTGIITVKKVDLIKEEYEDEKGGVYKLNDMGTGQGQAAYLLGRLNTNDNRKLIVFFDEVGLMDEGTLERIKDRLRELYKQGKLLVGLIVQKNDKKVEIISL